MIPRPKCSRCGGKLDVWHDDETGEPMWVCENYWNAEGKQIPMRTDEEHETYWRTLPGDEVAVLELELPWNYLFGEDSLI